MDSCHHNLRRLLDVSAPYPRLGLASFCPCLFSSFVRTIFQVTRTTDLDSLSSCLCIIALFLVFLWCPVCRRQDTGHPACCLAVPGSPGLTFSVLHRGSLFPFSHENACPRIPLFFALFSLVCVSLLVLKVKFEICFLGHSMSYRY